MEGPEIDAPSPGSPASAGAASPAGRARLASRPLRVLLVTAAVTAVLSVLATIDASGLAVAWEILHWNVSALGVTIAVGLSTRRPFRRSSTCSGWS